MSATNTPLLLADYLLWGNALACFGQAPTFDLTKTIGTPVSFPQDVAVDQAGFMYLLDGPGITKLAPNGDLVQSIVLQNYRGGGFGMGIDRAGNLYVGNYTYSRVEKYSPTGTLLLQFGSMGSGPGQFRYMNSLTVDAAGNLYATNRDHHGNSKLRKYDPSGTLLNKWGNLASLGPLAIDAVGNTTVLTCGRAR